MKQVITILLILIVYPGISKGIAGKVYCIEGIRHADASYHPIDTGSTNPYLNINAFELDIISPSSGVQLYENGLLFLSLSKTTSRMISKHISFGDRELHYVSLNDSVPGNQYLFNTDRPLAVPAEGISFTGDRSGFYYSKLSQDDGKVKIYRAEPGSNVSLEMWEINDEALSFCQDHNTYTHPTVSRSGDIMIFSSDMPGSMGGLDLYISRYENNAWTTPENMGNKFNSTGSELYACLDQNNNLYFSSDGLPGLGGFDIFFSNFNGYGWDDPVNLHDQINTDNDEVAFKINRHGQNHGFYTMIERSGIMKNKINRQLYKVELSAEYKNDNAFLLSDVLREYAMNSPLLAMQKDAKRREDEKLTEAQRIADSLRAEELKAERLAAEKRAEEQRITDSLETARLEAERRAEEQRIADSLKAAELEAEKRRADSLRAEELRKQQEATARDKVVYKVQFLSSMQSVQSKTISVSGKTYKTSEYFYKGAWRVTLGEFDDLEEAIEVRKLLREEGYDQAFVVAFVNGERSLDMDLFKR
ncbi:MAG: hypothetical protein U9N72_06665 [Bacteroidota bacterium]|nr:hypothetical protein [Bacteroidota bacterium]